MAIMSSVFGGDPEGTSPIEDTDDPGLDAQGTSPIEDTGDPALGAQGSSPLIDDSTDPNGGGSGSESGVAAASFDGADAAARGDGSDGAGGSSGDGTAPPLIGTPIDGTGEPMPLDG